MGVNCKVCGEEFEVITHTHLLIHNLTVEEYKERYPKADFHSQKFRENYSGKISGENHPLYGKEHPNKGKSIHTKESKRKISESLKMKWEDKEFKKKHIGENHPFYGKTRKFDETWRKKIGKVWKGRKHSEETKKKMSESAKEKFQEMDEEDYKEWLNNVVKSMEKKPTSLEVKTEKILDKLFPNEWRYVGDGSLWLGFPPMNPDFVHIERDIVIEVFAKFFKERNGGVDSYIKERMEKFNELGFSCVFFPAEEVSDELIKRRIENVIS